MKAILARLTARELAVGVFLAIALLSGAATVHALVVLNRYAADSHDATTRAVALTANAQRLDERGIAMQRAVRQFAILRDPVMHARYDEARRDAERALGVLSAALPPWQAGHTVQWKQASARAAEAMQAADPIGAIAALAPLSDLQLQLANDVRQEIERHRLLLLAELERSRGWLVAEATAALLAGAALAFAFGAWLARPPADLGELVQASIAQQRSALDASGVRIAVTGSAPPVRIDRAAAQKAIGDLIGAVAKASARGSTVWLGLSRRDGCVTLDCIATGDGSADGLPSVRACASAHGGKLESLPAPKGVHLRMSLPYAS